MSIKKCVNGSFVNDFYKEYGTDTDTITSLPKTIIGDGQPISSYTIKGNMVQSGTPTPSNPIYPQEVGDLVTTGEHAGEYKIPILSNGVSYPIYLSEPIRKIGDSVDTAPSTGTAARNIRKYEFTGQEQWTESDPSTNTYRAYTAVDANLAGASGWCSHVPYIITGISYDNEAASVVNSRFFLRLSNTIANDITSFKQYLATQYAAGTPVTVWYVLATAQTESFTTPTLPTTGTAEQFNVLTTLAPSEVSLTYHGWHEHEDTKYTT